MESVHRGACQNTERAANLMINRFPDEVLLEIFDSYRQSTDPYDRRWRRKCVWFNLVYVCRRWYAVMFASSFRLDLSIVVGPVNPRRIETALSSPLPIFIEYKNQYTDITGSALSRMRAALGHRDRVRTISFAGRAVSFETFIRETNHHFPKLESLHLTLPYDYRAGSKPDIPATFLRGPDQPVLRLRCLRLNYHAPLPSSVSGLLVSATALTDLTLSFTSANFDPSEGSFLFACLQGMQCLRNLHLTTPRGSPQDTHSKNPTPKNIVPLSKLTRFYYYGSTIFLNNFMCELSAPSLQDARFALFSTRCPILYLSRTVDDVKEEFRSVSVIFEIGYFRLLSSTRSGRLDRDKPSFWFNVNIYPDSINEVPSTKLAMAEELALFFSGSNITEWGHSFSLREFLCQFRSVRVLRMDPFIREVELILQRDDGRSIFPVLEEIEVSISLLTRHDSDENPEYQRRRVAETLAALEPFVSARERAGRHVKATIVGRYDTNETEM